MHARSAPPAERHALALKNAVQRGFGNLELLADVGPCWAGFGVQSRDLTLLVRTEPFSGMSAMCIRSCVIWPAHTHSLLIGNLCNIDLFGPGGTVISSRIDRGRAPLAAIRSVVRDLLEQAAGNSSLCRNGASAGSG
jgi:hypothetical protein